VAGFVKLQSSILDSSIWLEDAETRLVWITMLAMADPDGLVEASVRAIAHRARVTEEGCQRAVQSFQEPDPDSKDREHEGRRVERVDRGFLILNYRKYRGHDAPIVSAREWLEAELQDVPVRVVELREQAEAVGLAWRTVERAKDQLDVRSVQRLRAWWWEKRQTANQTATGVYTGGLSKKRGITTSWAQTARPPVEAEAEAEAEAEGEEEDLRGDLETPRPSGTAGCEGGLGGERPAAAARRGPGKRSPTDPPDALPAAELSAIRAWCDEQVAAGALGGWAADPAILTAEWGRCRDWHLAKGVRRASWPATYRNWLRKRQEFIERDEPTAGSDVPEWIRDFMGGGKDHGPGPGRRH